MARSGGSAAVALLALVLPACGSSPPALPVPLPVADQEERAHVVAVAEAALEAISREEMGGFADLMVPEAVTFSVRTIEGRPVYAARTRAETRETELRVDVVERGFEPEVLISGPVAVVWLPYDLYIDGVWSHCGVDIFTMVRTTVEWRIAAVAWSVEQPPACRPHPSGPPGRTGT